MRLSGEELMQATGGSWSKGMPEAISGIDTDTRKFIEGHAFLALRGPNFDGHRFADRVAAKAHALIGDEQGVRLWDDLETPQLKVEDTLIALGDIASAWRKRLHHTTVIAITGSFGKTTVRSMLYHLFTRLNVRTAATQANLNNLIGVPSTLLAIDKQTEVALIECGISEKGEMSRLSEIVQPDIAVITGISAAHSAGLGGLDGVAREKARLTDHLLPQGWCALGSGVSARLNGTGLSNAIVDMDRDDDKVVRWKLEGTRLSLATGNDKAELMLTLPAPHWAANMALAATIVIRHLDRRSGRKAPSLQEIATALSDWQAVDGRMKQLHSPDGIDIIDDSYNANPASMQAAIDTLVRLPGRKIAILGDMAELEDAATAHAGLDVTGIDIVILVGEQMQALKAQLSQTFWFASTEEALAWIQGNKTLFERDDHVLVKASRSMQLDRIVDLLAGREVTHAL